VDELLGIGDFSTRCGLSPKTLRSYARAGLLVPAAVDGASGYRYYSPAQLPQAQIVRLLRRAEVSVEEIAEFFRDPREERLERWDRELASEASSRRRAFSDARRALEGALGPWQWGPDDKEGSMGYRFSSGSATERGGRPTNEDSVLVGKDLWAVADGLGGLGNGDVASRQALEVVDEGFGRDQSVAGLLDACKAANRAVFEQGAERSPDMAMGTTLVALALTSDVGAIVVNVGDSRLYRLRDGRLVQLTKDHTVVADLIETGALHAEGAATHPHRHVLTRALGVDRAVDLDHAGVLCRPGDRLLLCTDGLFQSMSSDELNAVLGAPALPQASAEELVSAAMERGAEDNVTALVLSVS
jgi:PPM family protein phosphatase